MKKKVCLFLSLVLCLTAGTVFAEKAVIDGGKKPSVMVDLPGGSKTVGRYYTGTEAELFKVEGDWAEIEIGGVKGFIRANLLKLGDEAEKVDPMAVFAVVTADEYVNLRAKPSTDAKVVRRVARGEEIRVLGTLPGRWNYVLAGEDVGYVLDHFIKTYEQDMSDAIVDAGEGSSLVLMKKPDAGENDAVGLFYNGTAVKILSTKGDWQRVRIGQQEGWAKKSQLSPADKTQVAKPEYRTGKVNSPGGLNLRRGPSSGEEKMRTLKNGEFVYVMGETRSGWYYVMIGEEFGYVNSKYIQMDND